MVQLEGGPSQAGVKELRIPLELLAAERPTKLMDREVEDVTLQQVKREKFNSLIAAMGHSNIITMWHSSTA